MLYIYISKGDKEASLKLKPYQKQDEHKPKHKINLGKIILRYSIRPSSNLYRMDFINNVRIV